MPFAYGIREKSAYMRFIYTKTFAVFAFLVVLLAVFVLMQTKGWLNPVRELALKMPRSLTTTVKTAASPVKNFFSILYQLRKIAQENTRLTAQVISLQQNLVEANDLARENEALRNELGFAKTAKHSLAPCTVLSNDPFGSGGALILNCGSNAGVEIGQAVVSQGYLVAKIVYVGKDSSTALLITNSSFSVDARISQTEQAGIVKGSFGSGLILEQIPQTSGLEKGWLAVTAGINDKIPKNILIGEVKDILSSSNDLFKKAALVSPIAFNNLDFVFVMK